MKSKLFLLTVFSISFLQASHESENENIWTGRSDLPEGVAASVRQYNPVLKDKRIGCSVTFLYWRAIQQQMDLNAYRSADDKVDIIEIGTSYKPGFALDICYDLGYDGWMTGVMYTRFWRRSQFGTASPVGRATTGSGTLVGTDGVYRRIVDSALRQQNSRWRVGLDKIDFFLERPFYLGKSLVICPKVGLNASWIKQRRIITTTLLGGLSLAETSTSSSYIVGPFIEWKSCWFLNKNFAWTSNLGGALTYQEWDVDLKAFTDPINPTTDSKPRVLTESNWQVVPYTNASLGFEWNSNDVQETVLWRIAASYQFYHFWSQNLIRKVTVESDATTVAGTTTPRTGTTLLALHLANSSPAGALSYHGFSLMVGACY